MANETNLDLDPIETREWLDALQAVLVNDGPERGAFLLKQLLNKANSEGVNLTTSINTPTKTPLSHMKKSKFLQMKG
ncbi:Pyruvate dehydrogenase (decarboxylase component) E1p [Legionella cherrii]|uniref:Pyruvate dehydrogenase (Decarboxylase component) E1p n=1 Tax=Legionella cherrii TaxID=28084 RepID=A0ABY6T7K0_9GAMM|nr:Pyruvate dehydrogenase (decarboxylase component) E1p [Legionella cherrii]